MCKINMPDVIGFIGFLGGISAAYTARNEKIKALCNTPLAGCFAVICFVAVYFLFSTAFALLPIILLSIGFTIVACGNSLGGVLAYRGPRIVGNMGYSIYLLHGVFLYTALNKTVGTGFFQMHSPFVFWGLTWGISFFLVAICSQTFRYIELPGMRLLKNSATREVSPVYSSR